MYQDEKIWIAGSGNEKIYIQPSMANRHGFIAGATGTGKTITLKVMAESFSDAGVPVFLADVKGDLAGLCCPGVLNDNVQKRIDKYHLAEENFELHAYPVTFWDVYGEKGIPLRTTISEMGPLLLSRVLGLNETQSGVLFLLFKIADDNGLLLLDTKDLKALIQYVGENTKEYTLKYGNMTRQSLGAITRALVALDMEGGEQFFAEPALNIQDWFQTDENGRGRIQILDCQKLILHPAMYAAFLLWMLSELFEALPEAGDLEKPRIVFFFDEAHLLFDSASKELLNKIEQVVKLIRSKGVGVYFVTQNPKDIPEGVMSQLGNKVEHALHAYTPAEQKGVKAAAQAFRENPAFSTMDVMQELAIGEALVSALDENGVPSMVQRAGILPPQSRMGAIEDEIRSQIIEADPLTAGYKETFDRESAYEVLTRKAEEDARAQEQAEAEEEQRKAAEREEKERLKEEERERREMEKALLREERERQQEAERLNREMEKTRLQAEREQQREMEAAERERLKEIERRERERQKEIDRLERARRQEEAAREREFQRQMETERRRKQQEREEMAGRRDRDRAQRERDRERDQRRTAGNIGRDIGGQIGGALGGSFGRRVGKDIGGHLGRGIFGNFF